MADPHTQDDSGRQRHRVAVDPSQTTGWLLIAVMLLMLTLIRYWHSLQWSLR